ncbi:MAG: Ni,Fe-hydrogenase large subunit [Hydrogenothermus sp.]|nr:MAG: Ni,Fe-hydrogenase large subunit [Hydrogenothermus sp.]
MAKVEKRILNRVEGEVELKLVWEKGRIKDAFIIAPNFRGFEFILENKPLLDALVITPRVCGICGHAHLIATTNALENLYRENGYEIEVSQKAQLIRNITLSCEIIQNHIRWFYLFVIPDFLKFNTDLKDFYPIKGEKWRKAVYYSSKIVKIIAIFGGQWPHTSYSIPGGVMCEPTQMELMEAISIVDNVLEYFENDVIGMNIDDYFSIKFLEEFLEKSKGDLKKIIEEAIKLGFSDIGKAYDRFLTVCNVSPFISQGVTRRKKCNFDVSKVEEIETFSFLENGKSKFSKGKYSWAKAPRYEGKPFETGPLARRINNEDELFINLTKNFKGYYIPRIWARVDEIGKILVAIKKYLLNINLNEPSYIKPKVDIKNLEGQAYGFCEAARGSLIHKVIAKEGKIEKYDIITPTVWNLGTRCKNYLSPAEKAIIGLSDKLKAEMVVRSFDVCSVCTTH